MAGRGRHRQRFPLFSVNSSFSMKKKYTADTQVIFQLYKFPQIFITIRPTLKKKNDSTVTKISNNDTVCR